MKPKIALFCILILAAILRLWNLNNYPAGFNADEAAVGYNAYSIITTGQDEYGTPFPLIFKSFGDYKPGLYFYLTIPFVLTLGLNEWAIRLPSALLGVGTVWLVYLLSLRIFKKSAVGLIASFLIAISPWSLHFSRGGWETNAATFFMTLGAYLFLISLERPSYLIFSLISYLASMYTYQSPRLVVPVLLLVLFYVYKPIIFHRWKTLVKPLLVAGLLVLPLLFQFTSGQGGARFSGLTFLSDQGPLSRLSQLRGEHQNYLGIDAKLIHNKLTVFIPEFLSHYLDHFNPDFLFFNGDPLIRNKIPEVGQFYLFEAIFLIIGLLALINHHAKGKKLLIVWVLVAPLASAMTYQTPNALRALNMVIPLTVIMGFGGWVLINTVYAKFRYLLIFGLILIISFEFVHYLESYYVHYPKRYSLSWEYGFSEMVNKLQIYQNQYQKVVITDRYDQPYILVLFYEKYDPKRYQPQAILSPRDKYNFGTVRAFDKYEFRSIKPEEVKKSQDVLFVGTDQEIPPDANIIDKIDFPDGKPAFIFAKT